MVAKAKYFLILSIVGTLCWIPNCHSAPILDEQEIQSLTEMTLEDPQLNSETELQFTNETPLIDDFVISGQRQVSTNDTILDDLEKELDLAKAVELIKMEMLLDAPVESESNQSSSLNQETDYNQDVGNFPQSSGPPLEYETVQVDAIFEPTVGYQDVPIDSERTNQNKHGVAGVLVIHEIFDHQTPLKAKMVPANVSISDDGLHVHKKDLDQLESNENENITVNMTSVLALGQQDEEEVEKIFNLFREIIDEAEEVSSIDTRPNVPQMVEFVNIYESNGPEDKSAIRDSDTSFDLNEEDYSGQGQGQAISSPEIEVVLPTLNLSSENLEYSEETRDKHPDLMNQVFDGTLAFYFLVGPFLLKNNSITPVILDPTMESDALSSAFTLSLDDTSKQVLSSPADIVHALAQRQGYSITALQK